MIKNTLRSMLRKVLFLGLFLLCIVLVTGCATPVGVRYMRSGEAYRKLAGNVLAGGTLSATTTQILNRGGLGKKFEAQPGEAIATLHKGSPTLNESDRLFALAELSFLHATKTSNRPYYLAAALYAYAFLFPEDARATLDSFDPRTRTAVDMYNQGLAQGLGKSQGTGVALEAGRYPLPFGELGITVNPDEFLWGPFRLVDFVRASELDVRGLRNRYRWPGMGAALVGSLEELPGARDKAFARIPPGLKIPVTAFLSVNTIHDGLRTGHVEGKLELYTITEKTSLAGPQGEAIPLEFEQSAALAYTLEGSKVYDTEIKGLLSGDFAIFQRDKLKDGVFLMAPYRPGCIPVVLVHGTASSPARWAELVNELQNDRELWGRYQLWLFTYNTGNPILYSGGILVEGLRNIVKELDPRGKDAAMKKMVVIGHSQGGLLTRLTAVNSETRFWENASNVPIDQLDISPDTKELLRRSMFYTPLPFVRRVVFIATPHGGSFVSGGWVGRLAGKFIKLPFTLLSPLQEAYSAVLGTGGAKLSMKDVPKSTDNMDPKSPFVAALSSMPVAPGIIAHSIIPVDNPGAPKEKWNDGVVSYSSAHMEGVRSELIVHSSHSTQAEPQTIEEVRRILIENLREP